MKIYMADYGNEREKEAYQRTVKILFKRGMSIDEVAACLPALTVDELRKLEAEVMVPA